MNYHVMFGFTPVAKYKLGQNFRNSVPGLNFEVAASMSLSFLRLALRGNLSPLRTLSCKNAAPYLVSTTHRQPLVSHRTYASAKDKGKGNPKSTATLVPGSKQPITDEAARQEYAKAETSMQGSVEWYRKECAMVETRASGRITPALLSPVRVKLPDSTSELKLEEVATVGVRDGSTLLVTVFEENVRKVFNGLHTLDLPSSFCCARLAYFDSVDHQICRTSTL
jgi:ribosome recycling factor